MMYHDSADLTIEVKVTFITADEVSVDYETSAGHLRECLTFDQIAASLATDMIEFAEGHFGQQVLFSNSR